MTPGRKPDVFPQTGLHGLREHGAFMDEHESNRKPDAKKLFGITRRTVIETGATALLLATLPVRAAT
jgi:hypothetical protein